MADTKISEEPLADALGGSERISAMQDQGAGFVDVHITPDQIKTRVQAGLTVDATNFVAGVAPIEIVATLPVSGNFQGRTVFLTTDNKLYRYTGSVWTSVVPAVDITGQLTDAQLADIAAAKLTGQITATQITDGAVTTPKLDAGAVTAAKIAALTITANELAANAVTTGKLDAGAVTTPKLAAGAVTANELAANSVIAGKVAAAAISTTQLAAGAVTAGKISVTSLASITADLGAITAGSVTLDSAGYIKGGQTGYNTGTGFWLGYSGGTYKFSIGDGTKGFTWDGSALTINGTLSAAATNAVNTANLVSNSVVLPMSVYNSGSVSSGTLATLTLASATGAKVYLAFSCTVTGQGSDAYAPPDTTIIVLKRGATELMRARVTLAAGVYLVSGEVDTITPFAMEQTCALSFTDTSGTTGSVTFTAEILSGSMAVSLRSLFLMELKASS